MAAYRQGDDLKTKVIYGLTVCTPGLAPGPTLGNKYGRTMPFVGRQDAISENSKPG